MRRQALLRLAALLGFAVLGLSYACADSIWDRRTPNGAYLFVDNRARKVGDLLTVVVRETTNISNQEQRQNDKVTQTHALFAFTGNTNGNKGGRKAEADWDINNGSERKLQGQAQYTSDRAFLDRITVTVVQVLPNGNLVIEGKRSRMVHDEERTETVTGVVRPIDIGEANTVESPFVANFVVTYKGRGIESSYTQNGWLGKIMNVLWPY